MLRGSRGLQIAAWLLLSTRVAAEWAVFTQPLEGTEADTTVARIANESGHTLEFYRDNAGAIRTRFTLPTGLTALEQAHCPTLQVDRWAPANRSTDSSACLATSRWAEYTVGNVVDNNVKSERLLQLMNGSQITFRYRLTGGDYRDTVFSLAGSKRALVGAIGADITFSAP